MKAPATGRQIGKIGVESVLEVYHGPILHTETFAQLTEGEWECSYQGDHSVGRTYLTAKSKRWWAEIRRRHNLAQSARFSHYDHLLVFPNLAIGLTDGSLMSVQSYLPLAPGRSRLTHQLWLAGAEGGRKGSGAAMKAVQASLAGFNCQLLQEDRSVSEDVQRNLAQAPRPALLGSNEERLIAFHAAWRRWLEPNTNFQ